MGQGTVGGGWLASFAASSETGALFAATDWAATPLGPVAGWPEQLRAAVEICMSSRFPILVVWGPDLVKIYNEAYRPILGTEKHPAAMGAPAREVWPEIWDVIGPMFQQVLDGGPATWSEDQVLLMERNGYLEEAYFTWSYGPIRLDDGTVGGVIDVATETTEQVISRRRLACLSELAAELAEAEHVVDVCLRAVAVLRRWPADLPVVELFLKAGDGFAAIASSVDDGGGFDDHVALHAVAERWAPLTIGGSEGGARPVGAAERKLVPVGERDVEMASGVAVYGLSRMRPFDEGYRSFLHLVSRTIGAALTNAHRRAVQLGEHRRTSEALQHAMLSPTADVPTAAVRYLPASGNLAVGGDWYDLVELDGGRTGIVVGDCVGHGLGAATAMGQLRSATRALLIDGHGPASALQTLDRFAAAIDGAPCTTLFCAIADPGAGTLTYAAAGHPYPALLRADGRLAWLDGGRGLPLAVEPVLPRAEALARIAPGDTVVAYTDGLVERRDEALDAGLDRLAEALGRLDGFEVEALADELVLRLVLDPATDDQRDDVALVVYRCS
jgi:serine phosphatase RsbU (regulator of sigma subunit)